MKRRSSNIQRKSNYNNDSSENFKRGFRSDCKIGRNKRKTKNNYQSPKSKRKKIDGNYYFSEKFNKNNLNNIKRKYELRKRIKVVNYRESSSNDDIIEISESLLKLVLSKEKI